jgi:hypothetical protein
VVAVGHRRLSFLIIEMSLEVSYWSICNIGSEMLFDSTFVDELKSSFGAEQPAAGCQESRSHVLHASILDVSSHRKLI